MAVSGDRGSCGDVEYCQGYQIVGVGIWNNARLTDLVVGIWNKCQRYQIEVWRYGILPKVSHLVVGIWNIAKGIEFSCGDMGYCQGYQI